ncbi:secretory calcium-binding phosphoprotein 1 [Halichoeres trimaculatus]|uniref:secretory calcium-binding phosphoprotein 1 n=1 Tax=Halichoeres trimaculatus TaxID=147232 RepID=UPI003D9F6215
MKVKIVIFCLIGAVFANPISFSAVLLSSELDSNSTESLSVSQSSENDTSELKSSEENISNSSQSQSSESQSVESASEDTTSEESNSLPDEDDGSDSLEETRDDSMGSEENVRKSWVRVFASVIKVLSAEDNSTEVKGHSTELTGKQPTHTSTGGSFKHRNNIAQGHTNLLLVETTSDSSDSTDTSDSTDETAATSDSSQSTPSKESSETSEDSDSSDASKSTEDSNASDSAELTQMKDCVNGTQSCESDEYFFQDIGDDAHYSVDNLMVPDDDERELILRR